MLDSRHDVHATGGSRWLLFALAAVFVLCQLPVSSSLLFYHNDERHYIEAAQSMRETGDRLTPATRTESVRLRKPIITYWAVLAGQTVCGVNPLGLRIGFVLAGAAVIVLTETLARRAGCDAKTSAIAAMVMLGHVQLSLSATRAMPDVLQSLFMLISAIGAAELLLHDKPRRAAAWWLWIGAGLAVATKGMLAVMFLGYVAAWMVVTRRRNGAWRAMVYPPAIIVGVVIAAWWYVTMMSMYGHVLVDQFVYDQVAVPGSLRWVRPAYQIPMMLGAFVIIFLPWTLALSVLRIKRAPRDVAGAREKRFAHFTLGWALILAVVFGLGRHVTFRYIFVASPLVAVVIAGLFARIDAAQRDRVLRRVGSLLATSLAVLAVLAVAAHVQLGLWFYAAAVIAVYALVVCCAVAQRRVRAWPPALGLALIVSMIMPLLQYSVVWLRLPYPGQAVVQTLRSLPRADANDVVCVGDIRLPSRIALHSGGAVFPKFVFASDARTVDAHATLVLDDADRRHVDIERYDWHVVGSRVVDVRGPWALVALVRGDLAGFVEQHRRPIWLAEPK